jgi:hypothetical protein
MRLTRTTILVATIICMASAVSSASAGGFLADALIRPWNPHLADEADKLHAQLCNPLDHAADVAAGTAADAVVPGSGAVVTGALEARRRSCR